VLSARGAHRARFAVFLVAARIAWPVAQARADGVVRDGIGPASSGRAGTIVAQADDAHVLASNPAGLVNVPGDRRLDLGVDTYLLLFRYSDPTNDVDGSLQPAVLPEFSYAQKLDDGRLALGFAIYVPGGFGAESHLENKTFGLSLYRSFAALAKVTPAVAYRLTDRLAIGATLGVAVSYLRLNTPYVVQTGALAGAPTRVELRANGFAPAYSAGLQFDATDTTRLGVAWTGASSFTLGGRTRVTAGSAASHYDTDVDFTWPQSVVVGALQRIGARHRVSLDLTWLDWSEAFDRVKFNLTSGSNNALPARVDDALTLGWHDTYGVKVGYEVDVTPELIARAGYAYHGQPIPSARLTPLIPATLEHVIAVGLGWRSRALHVDVAYEYSWGPVLRVEQSAFVGGLWDNSWQRTEGYALFVGFGVDLDALRNDAPTEG
jgi:long-chain fatty acid transport protein